MQNYQNLKVWLKGIEIVKLIYLLSDKLPKSEQFGLSSQMRRAAVSIVSNIAEGVSRKSQTDFRRFLEIALGSTFELEVQVIVCKELKFFGSETEELLNKIDEEKKMLHSFMEKLKT
ncbi:MAG: four helix bundle protein [Chitinophagales bacterium]|nr:four helix bundle protein [Chitinophagales bacterium]